MSRDQLVAALWRDPPRQGANVVQQYVSALRRTLGRQALSTLPTGYRLDIDPDQLDVSIFRRLATVGEQRRLAGDLDGGLRALQEALEEWRGSALEDLPDCPFVEQESVGSDPRTNGSRAELAYRAKRPGSRSSRARTGRGVGRPPPTGRAGGSPARGALAEAGRQVDALAVYERLRDHLLDQLGVSPGEALRQAHVAVLRQDPAVVVGQQAPVRARVPRPSSRSSAESRSSGPSRVFWRPASD